MDSIGLYTQLTEFTNKNAGTSEWCKAKRDGKEYFIKKMQRPVYPSKDIGLKQELFDKRVARFHKVILERKQMYQALGDANSSGALALPIEVIPYQFHICTITEFIKGNLQPEEVHKLSMWQRLVLMRTLVLALMNVHKAGIVHGDMKMDNILITQNAVTGASTLKLIDFDASYKREYPPKTADAILGDMAYWAPEIYHKLNDEHVQLDERIDDFALGIILHAFWCGKMPRKPKNKTLGEQLFANEPIQLDASLPLVLGRTIGGLLKADPQERLRAEDVYDVLKVQMDKYPNEVVILGDKKKAKSTSSKEAPKESSEENRKETTRSVPSSKGSVDVKVYNRNSDGVLISSYLVAVRKGSTATIKATKISGYILNDNGPVTVTVSDTGKVNPTPEFFYRKRGRAFTAFWVAILLLIMYIGVGNFLINHARAQEDWEKADERLSVFLFYEKIFGDEAESIREHANALRMYNAVIEVYRQGKYDIVLEYFEDIPTGFFTIEPYDVLSYAHKNGPDAYYSQLANHLPLEDTASLLTQNNYCFCKFMEGSWTVISTNERSTMTMDANMRLTNAPELPNGGAYAVSNGKIKYKKKDSTLYMELFEIEIISKNYVTLYSYDTGITYKLNRE